MNIGINASQAMSNGGEIRIQIRETALDETYCEASLFDIIPGEYIEIEFSDTGSGISPDHLSKIFEPFFTTKGPGQGTGLGLSTAYGTIQDHSGEIKVKREIGVGTTFQILLPISKLQIDKKQNKQSLFPGRGVVLLVDDEEFNRTLGKEILESLGYHVLLAENGHESLKIFRERKTTIDLVLMDMLMPIMNGSEAFFQMKEIDETCKVIILSGHTKNENIDELMAYGLAGVIQKPYKISVLSQLLAEVLNGYNQ